MVAKTCGLREGWQRIAPEGVREQEQCEGTGTTPRGYERTARPAVASAKAGHAQRKIV